MKKYQATIQFEWNEEAMAVIEEHRAYINELIDEQVIEHYVVSMETQQVWITLNASNKEEAQEVLAHSPFSKFWTVELFEIFLWDGQNYRLPAVQLN
jgi:predicted GNAT family acetyltransferase